MEKTTMNEYVSPIKNDDVPMSSQFSGQFLKGSKGSPYLKPIYNGSFLTPKNVTHTDTPREVGGPSGQKRLKAQQAPSIDPPKNLRICLWWGRLGHWDATETSTRRFGDWCIFSCVLFWGWKIWGSTKRLVFWVVYWDVLLVLLVTIGIVNGFLSSLSVGCKVHK